MKVFTVYELRCGSVQFTEVEGRYRVELYREHDCYHVRALDYVKKDSGEPLERWRTWKSFHVGQLLKASREFKGMLKTFTGK